MNIKFWTACAAVCTTAILCGCSTSVKSLSIHKPVEPVAVTEKTVSFTPAYFDRVSTLIRPETMSSLYQVGQFLDANDSSRLILDSYGDDGNSPDNDKLYSDLRVKVLFDWLVSSGPFHIDSTRIVMSSHGGDQKSIQACKDDSLCHAKNRRVEFTVKYKTLRIKSLAGNQNRNAERDAK